MKHLILVGAGHAHLHILKKMMFMSLPHTKVTLITPNLGNTDGCVIERFLHSNGQQNLLRNEWNQLVRRTKVHWIDDHVVRTDTNLKMVYTKKGLQLPYDVLSLNIGAKAIFPEIPGLKEHAFPIKQNVLAASSFKTILKAHTCAVVGTSAFAFDFALSLRDRRLREGVDGPVYLIANGGVLPNLLNEDKRYKIEKWLFKRGVIPFTKSAVTQVSAYVNEEKTIYTEDGQSIDVQAVAWIAERGAHPISLESGLKVDAQGFIMAGPTLQVIGCDNVFATGSCKTFIGSPDVDRTGIFAKQEANILWSNLQQFINPAFMKSKLKIFVPNQHRFAVLNAGFRQTVLLYQDWMFAGGWCWWFKEQLS